MTLLKVSHSFFDKEDWKEKNGKVKHGKRNRERNQNSKKEKQTASTPGAPLCNELTPCVELTRREHTICFKTLESMCFSGNTATNQSQYSGKSILANNEQEINFCLSYQLSTCSSSVAV